MVNEPQSTAFLTSRNRLSYLWFALGIVFLTLGTARWTVPIAAWLYPIFLLRFFRTQPLWRGILLPFMAAEIVLQSTWLGFLPVPQPLYALLVSIMCVLIILPYLVARLIAPRFDGIVSTLIFPLAVTAVWYLFAVLTPWGTVYNPAYTQYGNLPLLQLLSVTGLWGVVFLMSWLASIVNWAWENGFAWPRVRGVTVLYAGILAAILLFGAVRLAFFPARGSTVRVAGISASQALTKAYYSRISKSTWDALTSGRATPAERERFRQAVAPIHGELLLLSEQEARAGAKIIAWPEYGAPVLQEDAEALISRAGTLARKTGTYLDLGVIVLLQQPVQSHFFLNETDLIDPTGKVVWRYEKTHPIPALEADMVRGDGKVNSIQTPYGRLSSVICYDMDFPYMVRQAGKSEADLMIAPGYDWREYDPYHAQMATFRAIENGFSLVRQASYSRAMAVDYEGNVLAASDYFTTDPQVMVAYVPAQGVRTIYAVVGDLFAWVGVVGLFLFVGFAFLRRPQALETGLSRSGE
jgi:apolipoprotein N-acyltransferase